MTRRTLTQVDAICTIATELRRRTRTALTHAQTIVADGYSSGSSGGGTDFNVRSKGGISDPTANAALARTTGTGTGYRLADHVQRLEQCIATAAAELGEALAIVNRLLPPPGVTPRCSGGAGLDGHLSWGDPTCANVPDGRPSYSGMCNACYQRRARWQREARTADVA